MRSWLNSKLLSHPLSVPVLLVAVILAVYYPAMLSGIHAIDDPGLFAFFSASPSLASTLMPGNGYYYRPLIEFSFYLDNRLWGMSPVTMHLENILLHCANSLLVYILARKVSAGKTLFLPLFAALLFALHPVNVEAVAWIAGRTDPLLALFVLSACYFWLRWLDNPQWHVFAAFLSLLGAALLTKETALAFGAVVLLLTLTWPGSATRSQRLVATGVMAVPGVLLVIFVLIFRNGTNGLHRFMAGADIQVAQAVWQGLIALGFYVRKLIVPFPLNFAITSVHPANVLISAILIPALWWAFRRSRPSGSFFLSAVLLIIPALLVAVKQVAWTPYAERYLYLSTAFLVLGLVGVCGEVGKKKYVVLLTFCILLLSGSAFSSFQRNLLWGNQLAFFQDAVVKSPEFGSVYYSLGGILMQQGDIDRASEAFTAAERLNHRVSMRFPIKASIMGNTIARSEYNAARNYFFQLFKKKQDAPAAFLELLYTADSKRLDAIEIVDRVPLAIDLLETLSLLNQKKPDPFWLYRSGQIALVTGNKKLATDFFRRAYDTAPGDAHYKGAAKVYVQRLEAER